jgi:hypothetical protein
MTSSFFIHSGQICRAQLPLHRESGRDGDAAFLPEHPATPMRPTATGIRSLPRAAQRSGIAGPLLSLLPILLLSLGQPARCQEAAPTPAHLESILPAVDDDALDSGPKGEGASAPSPTPAPAPSDWAAPAGLPSLENVQTQTQVDGTSLKPTIEWRSSADTTATDEAADEDLAPRVDLAGPGTPKWKVITYVSVKATSDDNIYISHANKQADVYFTASPGFAAGWGDFRSVLLQNASDFSDEYGQTRAPVEDPIAGDYAFIDYTANAMHFLSHDSADAVDQNGGLTMQWGLPKTVLGLKARVQTLSTPEIDLGVRTRRTIFTADATADYTISDKTSFTFDAGGTERAYATELSSDEYHGQLFMNYQWAPKTSIGVGVEAGLRQEESNPDQYYQQGLFRSTYNPTDRLSINFNGGIEVDEASGGANQLNPVFGLGANYIIDADNTFSLDASRSTSSSAVISGETTEITSANIDFRHRIYGDFSCALSVGYQNVQFYSQTLSTLARTDNYIFLRPSITYNFAQWSRLELAYEYHRDVSSQQSFDFGENVASLQIDFIF